VGVQSDNVAVEPCAVAWERMSADGGGQRTGSFEGRLEHWGGGACRGEGPVHGDAHCCTALFDWQWIRAFAWGAGEGAQCAGAVIGWMGVCWEIAVRDFWRGR
jgi:hypothetical protein